MSTPRLSVSTWSLHRALGLTYPNSPGADGKPTAVETYGPGSITLLDVPARLAAMGIATLEICHFHLPSRESAYLSELRAALDAAGVELFSLLIDDGDITHPDHGDRDLAWISRWIETAGELGAKRARVIAGKSEPSDVALQQSRAGFSLLATQGQAQGVRVMTENWFALLSRPQDVLSLLDDLEGAVGLCLDFGNWGGPTKYDDLAAIAPRAESCHAKCRFPAPGEMDTDDFRRCLDITRDAAFSGPYTLIYDGPGDDEWSALAMERDFVLPYLQET